MSPSLDRVEAARRRTRALASHVDTSPTSASRGVVSSPEDWSAMVGATLGPGEWRTVDQSRVDAFAECTEDHQWIHRAGARTQFGGPVAHGMLSLSLLPALCASVLPEQTWVGHELNCGFNRVRFVAPVHVGARVRAKAELVSVRPLAPAADARAKSGKGPDGVESVTRVTVEIEGGGKPALAAEWVTRQYAKPTTG